MSDKRKIELVLEYQNYIETPPVQPKKLYQAACSSDSVTLDSWKETWVSQMKENHKRLGSFCEKSAGKLFNQNKNRPAIIVGSGPSLSYNGHLLKDRGDMLALSCLHNYHFFHDRGIPIDYYVSLDAGPVVLEEISEGGKKSASEYWDSTKDKKLIAFIGSHPKLFELWQGEIFVFTCPISLPEWRDTLNSLEPFHVTVSTGGNVLGACLYLAKGIFGSNPIIFTGADFAFSQNTGDGIKFHGWDSKYDKTLGNVQRAVDVFGNKALTWPSYFNFKNFFDYVALTIPGQYINCTEGGILGAYPEGNIMAIKQMTLRDCLFSYSFHEAVRGACEKPQEFSNLLLY